VKGIFWAVLQQPIAIQQRYPNGTPHHITLQYGVERSDWEWAIGQEFEAIIWEEVWSDRIQALRVHVTQSLVLCCNAYPHITVSWVDGAEPVESNTLLAELAAGVRHQFIPWNPRQHVPCRIEFHEWEEGAIEAQRVKL
jgi:hypothetical protein